MTEPVDDLLVDQARLFSDARTVKLTRQRELAEALTRSEPESETSPDLDELVDLVADRVLERLKQRGIAST